MTQNSQGLRGVIEASFISLIKSEVDTNNNFTVVKDDEIFLTEQYIESFNITIPGALAASQFTFEIVDPLWEFIDRMQLQDLNNTRFLKVRFRFGWNATVHGSGVGGTDMTDWMIGSITTHTPNYNSGSMTITLQGVGVQLENDLFYINSSFPLKAKNKRDLYTEVASVYNINLVVQAGELDAEEIIGQIPLKEVTQTPLDYLARTIFMMFPPTIGGKPCFARFNPYQSSFVLEPMDTANIVTTYDYGSIGSFVISYSPTINPWLQLKASKPITSVRVTEEKSEEDLGERTQETVDFISNDTSTENKIAKIRTNQENHLQKAVQASLELLGDVGASPHSYILVNTFHPNTGAIHSSTAFFIKNVTHTVSSNFITSLDLVMAPPVVSDRTREVTIELQGFNIPKKITQADIPDIVKQQEALKEYITTQGLSLGGLVEITPDSKIIEKIQEFVPGKNK